MKKIVCLFLVTVFIFSYSGAANAITFNEVPSGVLYQPEDVLLAVEQLANQKNIDNESLVQNVFLKQSMGIETVNIDMRKVAVNTKISKLNGEFFDALMKHEIDSETAKCMTLSEFRMLEGTWKLEKEEIEIARRLYPELSKIDISNWTHGEYKNYYMRKNRESLAKRFSEVQHEELKNRGINLEDTFFLFKEFHNADVILAQSDEVLKDTIEAYYQVKLDMLASLTIPDQTKYFWVDFPRYGEDWFLNEVETTEYWMGVQADRTLKTQQVLYNSTSNELYCTNMYGTYSQSQEGAHEGIDFAIGTTESIYAVFDGKVKSGGLYHQLSVYDVNSPDEPKTYTYLHMSAVDKAVGSTVSAYEYVGKQGMEGNATGYHVHFEVHSGSTTTLSPGNDDVLGSLSPYRLQDYIGEL
jgi:hypothetical protein